MTSIYIKGEDRTRQIADWKIRKDHKRGGWCLVSQFHSGKSFSAPLDQCAVEPTKDFTDMLLTRRHGHVYQALEWARVYGDKYAMVRYAGGNKDYLMRLDNIRLHPRSEHDSGAVWAYFHKVLEARAEQASADNKGIVDNLIKQMERLPAVAESALAAYCLGHSEARTPPQQLIFPFGTNASQLKAVEHAFQSQISLIQGPPRHRQNTNHIEHHCQYCAGG